VDSRYSSRSWGVYGVLSYSVNQQTREIGVRMAMGAQSGRILSLVVEQGMRLAIAGLTLGILIALAATRVLSSLLFGVSAHDPLIFVGVSVGFGDRRYPRLLHPRPARYTRRSLSGTAL